MLRGLQSLFVRSSCPLCDRAAQEFLCPWCERQLEGLQRDDRADSWQGELPWLAWGNYGGILKRAIAALKYENHPELARLLGFHLGKAWLDFPISQSCKIAIVVPIPLHARKLEQRGFNQAELIGRSFCQRTGLRLRPSGLVRCQETEAMFGLQARDRAANVAEAFAPGKSFQKRPPRAPVLLIDDIYTTGATVNSAARCLRESGVKVIGAVAVAAAVSKNHPSSSAS